MPEQQTIQCRMKVCECGSHFIPSYYPSNEMSEPDENDSSFVIGIIPAWICPNCGTNKLVTAEEKQDWLGASVNFQCRSARTINAVEHMLTLSPKLKGLIEGEEEARQEGKVH